MLISTAVQEAPRNLVTPTDLASARPWRVVVVDDQEIYRRGLAAVLTNADSLQVVATLACTEDAVSQIVDVQPDVVVLGELRGVWDLLANALHRRLPRAALVVLLDQVSEEDLFYALRAGARACRQKMMAPETLLRAMDEAVRGLSSIRLGDITSGTSSRRVKAREHLAVEEAGESAASCPLSERETEILVGVAEGCSNKQIGQRYGISDQTVKNHLTAVLRKLGVSDRTEAVVCALRHRWLKLESLRIGNAAA